MTSANIIRNIMMMTAVEKELGNKYLGNLLLEVWDMIGCEFEENKTKVEGLVNFQLGITEVVEDLKYEFTINQMIKYYGKEINAYIYKYNEYMLNNLDFMDDETIVKQVIYDIITKDINSTLQNVLNNPPEENNDIINDLDNK